MSHTALNLGDLYLEHACDQGYPPKDSRPELFRTKFPYVALAGPTYREYSALV